MRDDSAQPVEWSICPACNRPYGFIACKVGMNDGRTICLRCAAEEERAVDKLKEQEKKRGVI